MRDASFRRLVLSFGTRYGRHGLPWRKTINPYHILVSEIMLQQTQVSRAVGKYREFLRTFPSFRALATAPTSGVLKVWQGLGYNRRALMLQRCAQAVVRDHGGKLPTDHSQLTTLPGVGPYTAGAILAFAFDVPHPVIETNIRRVYLHHFFAGRHSVPDADILPLVARHVGRVRSPRRWYGALMDYGTHLGGIAKHEGRTANPNLRSRHHVKQSRFEGSLRQLRGRILRHLAERGPAGRAALAAAMDDSRLSRALVALEGEGFIRFTDSQVRLVS